MGCGVKNYMIMYGKGYGGYILYLLHRSTIKGYLR